MAEEYAIVLDHIVKKYGKQVAIDDMSLSINKDQIIGLIGANGSGKTTMFKMIAGLEDYKSGRLSVLGGDVCRDIRVAGQIAFAGNVSAELEVVLVKTLLENYKLMYEGFDYEFATKLLEIFEIDLKKKVVNLSQGMKSALYFILVLSTRASITLLDEPFNGIDIAKRKMAADILMRDYMEHPRTIIVSSHNLAEIENIFSELILIDKGRLVMYEEMDDVREMLFRADGDKESVDKLTEGVVTRIYGNMSSCAYVKGAPSSEEANKARSMGLSVSAVAPEDVCVYLTSQGKDAKVDELWK